MKTIRGLCTALCIICVAIIFTGCATMPGQASKSGEITKVLDELLPATFTGDARLHHHNTYFTIDIWAGKLRRDPAGWTYDWLVWKRDGFISNGTISLGQVPIALPP